MKTHVEFKNGQKMPIIGYGLWQCENPQELESAINVALEAGYRHFDTAFGYGNESVVGKVLKNWIDSGKGKREELFITTKLPIHGVHHEKVEKYITHELQDLHMDYVDLYLIHNPASIKASETNMKEPAYENGEVVIDTTTTLEQVWKAMEEQVKAGRAKAIGLSNCSVKQVERIVKCANIPPANLQVELNANYPRKAIRDVCAKHGITVCAFAPLGSPGRKEYYEKTRSDNAHLKAMIPNLIQDPTVTAIAKKHSKTPAQVLLRFLAQQDIVAIPKSVTPSRIKANIDIFNFELDSDDMSKLDGLKIDDEGTFGFDWACGLPGLEKHPEFQLRRVQNQI